MGPPRGAPWPQWASLALGLHLAFAGAARGQFTERISIANDGVTQGNESAFGPPAMSADGRFIAFTTLAATFSAVDSNGWEDVYVADLTSGLVKRVSLSSSGVQGNDASGRLNNPVRSDIGISDDGNLVAFTSLATNLIDCALPGAASDCGFSGRDLFLHDRRTGSTTIQNVSQVTGPGNGQSPPITEGAAISGDGRWLAFVADLVPLVDGDLDEFGPAEVYLKQIGGNLIRASVDTVANQGISAFGPLALSNDGNRLVYVSASSTLVAGDTNGQPDVFMFERSSGVVTRVSVADDETEANNASRAPSISGDGRYVVFFSSATDLLPPAVNNGGGVYIRDLQLGTTTKITGTGCVPPPAFGCTAGTSTSTRTSISDDGRWIAFDYTGNDLFWPGDSNVAADVYLFDRVMPQIYRISVSTSGGNPNFSATTPAVSDNGPLVAYTSFASDLVGTNCGPMPPGPPSGCDTNNRADVFLGSPADAVTFLRPIQSVFNRTPRSDGQPGFSLVADKELVVRAFVRTPKALGPSFDALTEICVDGLVGACAQGKAFQATGKAWAFGSQFSEVDRRAGLESINVFLRDGAESILDAGTHTFDVRLSSVPPGAFPDVLRKLHGLYRVGTTIDLYTYPVELTDAGANKILPESALLETADDFVQATYPVDEQSVKHLPRGPQVSSNLPAESVEGREQGAWKLVRALAKRLADDLKGGTGARSFGAGVLPHLVNGSGPMFNWSGVTWPSVSGVVLTLDRYQSVGGGPLISSVLAHELGHQLGFGEEYCFDSTVGELVLETPCLVEGMKFKSANPPPLNQQQGDEVGNFIVEQMEAFDVSELVTGQRAIFGPPGSPRYGYMGGTIPEGSPAYWTSPKEYQFLYETATTPPAGPLEARALVERSVLFITGLMDQAGAATLDPFLILLTDVEFPPPLAGSTYTLEILDQDGGILATLSFDLSFQQEVFAEDVSEVVDVDVTPFSLAVDLPNGAETVRLRQGATTLAEVEKTANAPTVAFTDVTAQPGNVLDLEWMGSDLDGDDLTYSLYYSPNGVALESLVVDLEGTTFSFDLDDVTPLTFGGFLRVRASDDWNYAEDDYPIGPVFAVLDVDASGVVQPLTDGLLVLRHLFGFTGATLINGAVGGGCSRCLAADITAYLNGIATQLDVDGNGAPPLPLTDGLLVLRYLFGFTGTTLTNGAVGGGCTRCDGASIVTYLGGLD